MKIKFTRRDNDSFEDFTGEDEYFGGFGEGDNGTVEDDVYSMGSLHTQPAPEAAAPFTPASAVALKIVNPKGHESASEIADFLMNGNTVLLNVDSLSRESAIRLLDYLSGAVHVIGGVMTKVGKTTIVVAPKNVDVSSIEAIVGSAE